jgi:hypothetical protein
MYDLFDKGIQHGNNATANNQALRRQVIPGLICPSNPQEPVRNNPNQVSGYCTDSANPAGGLDYVGCLGHIWSGWKDCGNVPDFPGPPSDPNLFVRGSAGTPWVNGEIPGEQVNYNGVFRETGSVRLADIVDGTSNTIAVFEDMHWQGNNPHRVEQYTDEASWASPLAAVHTIRMPMNNKNPAWLQGNDRRCHGWSSLHPGGAHAVLADGTVKFFNDGIDHVTRYGLGVRNDGISIKF